MSNDNEIPIFSDLKKLFKKTRKINVDDLGIYHEIFTFNSLHDGNHALNYDIYAKIKAVEVYENLVEVDVLDIKITDSVSQDIMNLIKNNFPRYVNPKNVKWQIKN